MKLPKLLAILLTLGISIFVNAQIFNNVTVTGDFTATTGQNSISDFNQNGVVDLDGIKYTTLQSAINAACSSSGGTVRVKPNYTETLSNNVTIPHAGCAIEFLGPATIMMQTWQVLMPSSANGFPIGNISISGASTPGFTPGLPGYPAQTAADFVYSGSGYAFEVGDASAQSFGITISNISCDIHSAGSTAGCFDFIQIGRYKMENISGYGANIPGQIFLLLDGTGSANVSTTEATLTNLWSGSFGTCVRFGGASGPAQSNVVIGGGCPGDQKYGLDFEDSSSGNIVVGYDVEGAPIAVNMGGANYGNRVSIYGQGNGNYGVIGTGGDFTLGPHTIANTVDNIGANCSPNFTINVMDTGQNRVINPCNTPFGSGLPAYANGNTLYCSDCNATCTAGNSGGRTCFRENGIWTH